MILNADAQMIPLAAGSVQCVVTSPPYFGLRRYGLGAGELGHEGTPEEFVGRLVACFREVRRVLRADGVLWVVVGDSYASRWPCGRRNVAGQGSLADGRRGARPERMGPGLKDKDLIGVPWMLAFALRDDGWWLRQDIVWSKGNPMPESVRDRCTRSHEYVFMFSKAQRYFYDADAVAEPRDWPFRTYRNAQDHKYAELDDRTTQGLHDGRQHYGKRGARNLRSVWRINTEAFPGAHYATFPRELARRCIRAGSAEGDVVLDPFCGSGTTVEVANAERRAGVGLDLVMGYCRDHALRRARKGLAEGSQVAMPL